MCPRVKQMEVLAVGVLSLLLYSAYSDSAKPPPPPPPKPRPNAAFMYKEHTATNTLPQMRKPNVQLEQPITLTNNTNATAGLAELEEKKRAQDAELHSDFFKGVSDSIVKAVHKPLDAVVKYAMPLFVTPEDTDDTRIGPPPAHRLLIR